MAKKRVHRILELYEFITKMPGHDIHLRNKRIRDSHYVLDENFNQIIGFIDDFEGTFSPIRYTERLEHDYRELKRLLHNYSASVFSFLQHMNAITSENKIHDFSEIYEEQRKKYESHDVRQFIIRLRVFMQHIDLIDVSTKYSFSANSATRDIDIKIQLLRDELLKWNDWKSQGKRYLKNSPEYIHLRIVLAQHKLIIDELYNNTFFKIFSSYQTELEEYNIKVDEYNKLKGKVGN